MSKLHLLLFCSYELFLICKISSICVVECCTNGYCIIQFHEYCMIQFSTTYYFSALLLLLVYDEFSRVLFGVFFSIRIPIYRAISYEKNLHF
jgi:hypothetical protein